MGNDPFNGTDPTGLAEDPVSAVVLGCALNPVCKTAAATAIGGVVGGVVDVAVNGIPSNRQEWTTLGGAIVAGGVNGALVANGAPPAATGAVVGATQSVTVDVLNRNYEGMGTRAVASGGTGLLGGAAGARIGAATGRTATASTVQRTSSIPAGAAAGVGVSSLIDPTVSAVTTSGGAGYAQRIVREAENFGAGSTNLGYRAFGQSVWGSGALRTETCYRSGGIRC